MKIRLMFLVGCLFWTMSCKKIGKEKNSAEKSQEISVVTEQQEAVFMDLEGNAVSLSDFKGKRILLNFWATWCKPCIQEMPSLMQAKPVLEKEGYVILLASEESLKTIQKFKQTVPYKFKYLRYTGGLVQFSVHALPTTFIFSESGEKVHEIIGATTWDSPEMIKKLKAIE